MIQLYLPLKIFSKDWLNLGIQVIHQSEEVLKKVLIRTMSQGLYPKAVRIQVMTTLSTISLRRRIAYSIRTR